MVGHIEWESLGNLCLIWSNFGFVAYKDTVVKFHTFLKIMIHLHRTCLPWGFKTDYCISLNDHITFVHSTGFCCYWITILPTRRMKMFVSISMSGIYSDVFQMFVTLNTSVIKHKLNYPFFCCLSYCYFLTAFSMRQH